MTLSPYRGSSAAAPLSWIEVIIVPLRSRLKPLSVETPGAGLETTILTADDCVDLFIYFN